jgi:hypothetical protein
MVVSGVLPSPAVTFAEQAGFRRSYPDLCLGALGGGA